jgi:hypothetical protein
MKKLFEVRLKGSDSYKIIRVCANDLKEVCTKLSLKRSMYYITERKDLRPINNKLSTN